MANALSNFINTSSHDQLLSPIKRLKEGKRRRKLSNAGRYLPMTRHYSNVSLPCIDPPTPSRTHIPGGNQGLLTRKFSLDERVQHGLSNMVSNMNINADNRLPDIVRADSPGTETKLSDIGKHDTPQAESELQGLTPEPEVFRDFKLFENGLAVLTEEQKRRSSYRPIYCWCNRCQVMYSLYVAGDPVLEHWGNYPCHQW